MVLYPKIVQQLGIDTRIPFFGFGAGGASRIAEIAYILHRLGFKRVGAIYDGDKQGDYRSFLEQFGQYGYQAWIIPADDIRDKNERQIKGKVGLVNEKGTLKLEYSEALSKMIGDIVTFLH